MYTPPHFLLVWIATTVGARRAPDLSDVTLDGPERAEARQVWDAETEFRLLYPLGRSVCVPGPPPHLSVPSLLCLKRAPIAPYKRMGRCLPLLRV
jgi:hypothetical protein